MEWIEKLNQAINYIENNLEGDIDYNEAAKIACCSTFHFQRMFSYIAGVTLGEYIRRRRMTKAAFDLQNSSIKILDLAARYSYDSPTSFSRAFQNIHDITPVSARKMGVKLKSYPKLIFNLSVKGEEELQYRIEEKGEIHIVGIRKRLETDMEKNFLTIPRFWKETKESGVAQQICKIMNQDPKGILGVSSYESKKDYYYYIAAATDSHALSGMIEYKIPAATWVIFECTGNFKENVQEIYKRFYTEWLPFSGYEYAETEDIEIYPVLGSENDKVEVWFAIKHRYIDTKGR